uniref:G/T mismatch-specific thymine DNA glycosylase n=1 Tax=Cynoglossus semilaevis TaxID=244447 RepID=A0A3P8ULZ0_CYNSE
MYDRYQYTQQHRDEQYVMQYHNMTNFIEDSETENVLSDPSVHWEPPPYQESSYQNYPAGPNHYQEQMYQYNDWEQQQDFNIQSEPVAPPQASTPVKKKRGRPSKAEKSAMPGEEEEDQAEAAKKAKRILNRFNGMSVAEVMAKTLPDVITYSLDILIIGINPGLMSAYKGHHYPNPGNHFWKCIFLSGLTDQQLSYMHDQSLPEKYGIGFTNMVERTTPGSKDLSNKEIREGGRQLLEKLQLYKPLIAAFNGKGIYEIFCKETFGVKAKNLEFGLQPYKIPETETVCFLMPSSSPRCAQFPRAQDKVHFYIKLKELRDQIKGLVPGRDVLETNYSFDLQLAKEDAKRMAIKEEQYDPGYEDAYGGAYAERGPEGSQVQGQVNGHCTFPSVQNQEEAQEATTSQTSDGQVPDGQWMTQSFADQIPEISGGPKDGSL